nr:protein spotted leaf 11 [Ipomoea trifida]
MQQSRREEDIGVEMEVKSRAVKNLVTKLSSVSERSRTEAICELRIISKNDAESRPLIADAGAIPYLAESLYSSDKDCQENATAALHNLSISSKDALISTRGLLDALSHALRNPSSAFTAQCAASAIFSLLTVEDYRPIIGHKRDIVFGLIDIARNPNSASRSIKDALKALFGIALYPLNRSQIIELGAVPALFSLVCKDGRVGILEDVTAVIAQIAGCEESWEAFRKVSGVGVLVDLLDNSTGASNRTKENAVSALLNLVQCSGKEVTESIRGLVLGAVDGIIEVAENGSEKGRSKAMALLKLLDVSSCEF